MNSFTGSSEPGKRVGIDAKIQKLAQDSFLRAKGVDPAKPKQLTIWGEDFRELPNDFARSSIWTVRNKKEERQVLEGVVLFHLDKKIKVTYTGIELRADDDKLLYLQLVHYARETALGSMVGFNLHQLCTDLGWTINGRNYERCRMCISRLKATEVRVTHEEIGRGVSMSFIASYSFNEDDGKDKGSKYIVSIPEELILLVAGGRSTRLLWEPYRDLTPIAGRLCDYLASHKQPFALALDRFKEMCGSSVSNKSKWRQMVRAACIELVEARLVKSAWVEADKIYFVR
jgi:TrfA protein